MLYDIIKKYQYVSYRDYTFLTDLSIIINCWSEYNYLYFLAIGYNVRWAYHHSHAVYIVTGGRHYCYVLLRHFHHSNGYSLLLPTKVLPCIVQVRSMFVLKMRLAFREPVQYQKSITNRAVIHTTALYCKCAHAQWAWLRVLLPLPSLP